MSQLVEVLYPVPDLRRTPLSSLRWWESRRLTFNKAVGSAGLVTIASVSGFFLLGPSTLGPLPLLPMLVFAGVYAVAANMCYSLGWMAEMAARLVWGHDAPKMGPLLFRQGLIFSVGLTLMPVLLMAVVWFIHVVLAIVT